MDHSAFRPFFVSSTRGIDSSRHSSRKCGSGGKSDRATPPSFAHPGRSGSTRQTAGCSSPACCLAHSDRRKPKTRTRHRRGSSRHSPARRRSAGAPTRVDPRTGPTCTASGPSQSGHQIGRREVNALAGPLDTPLGLTTNGDMRFSSSGRNSHALLTFRRLRKLFIAITPSAVNTSRLSAGIVPGP